MMTAPTRRLSPEQTEELMIPRIIEALYPVLIPVEQQDCAIQQANHAKVTSVALIAWRAFAAGDTPSNQDAKEIGR